MSENNNIKEVIISANTNIDENELGSEERVKDVECVKSLHEEVRQLKEKLTIEHNTVQDLLKKLEAKIEATSPLKLENPEIIVEKQPAATKTETTGGGDFNVKIDNTCCDGEVGSDEKKLNSLFKNLFKNLSGEFGDFKVYKVEVDMLPNSHQQSQQFVRKQKPITIFDILIKAFTIAFDRVMNIFCQFSAHLLEILPIFFIFVQVFARILIPFGNPFKKPEVCQKPKFE